MYENVIVLLDKNCLQKWLFLQKRGFWGRRIFLRLANIVVWMLAAVFIDVSGVIKSQMASTNSEIFVVEEKLAELEVNDVENHENESNIKERVVFEPHLSGFEIRDLYKIALNFYKGTYHHSPTCYSEIQLILIVCLHFEFAIPNDKFR